MTIGAISTSNNIVVWQDGCRHQGCDESSGWVWYAAETLERAILASYGNNLERLKILELGSGTGWLALRLALHGAMVTASDRKGALPLLWKNVCRNQERNPLLQDMVDVQELEWGDENYTNSNHSSWDVVIGSDILYLKEAYRPLLETCIRSKCHKFVFAWEERKRHEEQEFPQLAKEMGFRVDQLLETEVNPVSNSPVSVVFLSYGEKI